MSLSNNYSAINLTGESEYHRELFDSVTHLFRMTFPNSGKPNDMVKNPKGHIGETMACLDGSEVVGGLRATMIEPQQRMLLDLLAVDLDKRNSGIGSFMLEQAEQRAIDQGMRKISLVPMRSAIDFYKSRGYMAARGPLNIPHLIKYID